MARSPSGPRIASSEITPLETYMNRRALIAGATSLGLTGLIGGSASAAQINEPLKAATGFPAPSDPPTEKKLATTYNNFYEFGTSKSAPAMNAHRLTTRPWTVEIIGEVHKPRTISIEDLLAFPLEERIYRFRCVEAWSMVIPWVGFEFNKITTLVEPTSRAKFVRFTTAERPSEMPGLGSPVLDWPYTEALRMDEAMHPLTLLTLGMYGETLPNQNGEPVRLIVPWKYGYKSAKSIVKIEFLEKQPVSSWTKAAAHEYGFYSNVNPNVDHPRWSQKRERLLPALFASRTTEMFNGYGEQVASLYAGMDLKVNH
jgi:sulfoxide reductase catalytic subunit YedY